MVRPCKLDTREFQRKLTDADRSILCQDNRVFEAMMQSGSPCPINGSIGDAAKRGWYERNPSIFKKLYGETYTIPLISEEPITTNINPTRK